MREGQDLTTTEREPDTGAAGPSGLRGRGELVLALMLLVVAGILLVGNLTMNVIGDGGLFGPTAFPWIIITIALVLAALLVRAGLTKPEETRRADAAAEVDTNWTAFVIVLGALVGFTLLLDVLGWLLSATLLFAAVAEALGNRHHVRNLAIGFILASVVQIVFSGVLDLALPAGFLAGS